MNLQRVVIKFHPVWRNKKPSLQILYWVFEFSAFGLAFDVIRKKAG